MNPPPNDHFVHPKITAAHYQRLAFVYIRQSTPRQVIQNQESQQNQYRLRQRAEELGWPADRVRVIDSDLGVSGSEAAGRSGFQELVTEISLGHAGIVFGYEVSRLARNNADWYQLLDLAAVFGTLIADSDGIYDPRVYNDRLLLGLKGTMSEAELHLLRQRLDAGRMNQVKRGAYRQRLPTGYLRLPDGRVIKDPDDQVRHVIELTFAKFEELGSVNKVIRYLRHQGILFPRRQHAGPQINQMLWKVASESAVTGMLKNPAYAGAFAYGRRQNDPTLRQAGRPTTGNRRKPMAEWLHLQQNVYPAYITWEQYLANQERIRQNGLRFTESQQKAQGIVRQGPGLLQGLVVCGHCGHRMQTAYKPTPRYHCHGLVRTAMAPSECNAAGARGLDEMVVQAFFEVLQPAQLDALEAILASRQADRDQLVRQWQDQLKRAQYEVHQAQRQYDAVDPDNRLVAAELERRWETKLQQLRQTEEAFHHFQQTPLPETIPPDLRSLFQEVSSRLPELWPALSNAQKKELLRSMIQRVIIRRPARDRLAVRIVWISGCFSDYTTLTPVLRQQDVSGFDRMLERIQELCKKGYNDDQIAKHLTEEGFHTARLPYVTSTSVQKIRLVQKWYSPFEQCRGIDSVGNYLTVNGMAKQLGVSESTIYRYIYQQIIPTEYVVRNQQSGVYLIHEDGQLIEQMQQQVEKNKHRNGMMKSLKSA
jgi:DNA invertase Pin-like site-specific DNA recombinase